MKAISCSAVVAALATILLAVGCDRAQRGEAGPMPAAEGQGPSMHAMEASGAAAAPAEATEPPIAQKTCPVMGGPIDPSIFLDYQGRRVYFCCQACQAEFKKNPDKYLQKLDEQPKAAQEPAMQ